MKYDLEERCVVFGEDIIELLRGIKKDDITTPVIRQLIRFCSGFNLKPEI